MPARICTSAQREVPKPETREYRA
uniref:Uncharacterized protein n=1 Tax=Anopheles minimus TaxID=112268 RepID=A0A182WQF7_9DIPT